MPALEPFEPLGAREAPADAGPRALLLPVGEDLYAVGLERVRIVVERPEVARLPGAAPAVLGVVNVRGEVLPVLDTAKALGVGSLPGAPYVAVVDTARGRIGLAAGGAPSNVVLGAEVGASGLASATSRHRVGTADVATLVDVEALAHEAEAGA